MNNEERLSRVEGSLEQIDRRISNAEKAVSELRGEISGRFDQTRKELAEIRDEISRNNRWLISIIFVIMWVITIMVIVFSK